MSRGREGILTKAWWFVVLRVDLDMELKWERKKKKMAKKYNGDWTAVCSVGAGQEPG
jgi:hypothetical protein